MVQVCQLVCSDPYVATDLLLHCSVSVFWCNCLNKSVILFKIVGGISLGV